MNKKTIDENKSTENEKTTYLSIKKKYWTFIIYPESMPIDWKDVLQATGLCIAVSPLHDKDLDPGTGILKKHHYHVIACFNGNTTFNSVKRITDSLNAPSPKPIESVKGLYRYLTHMDNPDKAQYQEKDILKINGFNVLDVVEIAKSEVIEIKKELILTITEKEIVEYADLMDYVMYNCSNNFFDVASSNTYFFDKYITSRRNKSRNINTVSNIPIRTYVNAETGEIYQKIEDILK